MIQAQSQISVGVQRPQTLETLNHKLNSKCRTRRLLIRALAVLSWFEITRAILGADLTGHYTVVLFRA